MADQAGDEGIEGEVLVSGIIINQRYVQHVLIIPDQDGYYIVSNADESYRERTATMDLAMRLGETYLQAYADGYLDGRIPDDHRPTHPRP